MATGLRAAIWDPSRTAWSRSSCLEHDHSSVLSDAGARGTKGVVHEKTQWRVYCASTSPQGTALVRLRFARAMLSGAALGGNLYHWLDKASIAVRSICTAVCCCGSLVVKDGAEEPGLQSLRSWKPAIIEWGENITFCRLRGIVYRRFYRQY